MKYKNEKAFEKKIIEVLRPHFYVFRSEHVENGYPDLTIAKNKIEMHLELKHIKRNKKMKDVFETYQINFFKEHFKNISIYILLYSEIDQVYYYIPVSTFLVYHHPEKRIVDFMREHTLYIVEKISKVIDLILIDKTLEGMRNVS